MDKDYILIRRENLQMLIEDAHKWKAMEQCTELIGELKPEEWDAVILEYCESTGITFPSNLSGKDALDFLIRLDTNIYNEV